MRRALAAVDLRSVQHCIRISLQKAGDTLHIQMQIDWANVVILAHPGAGRSADVLVRAQAKYAQHYIAALQDRSVRQQQLRRRVPPLRFMAHLSAVPNIVEWPSMCRPKPPSGFWWLRR